MNQLFNTVNYFEFQASEALRRWKLQAFTDASRNHTPFPNSYFFLLTSYFSYVPGNKKAAEAFLRAAAFG